MYVPPAFAVSNLATLHDFVERHSFGLLVSQLDDVPFATHLPFLLDRQAGVQGTLIGHFARANPHWRSLADQSVLALFQGPHVYVSPTWYEAEDHEADQIVPTWNYQAVHVTGQATIIEDEASLREIVERLTFVYEQRMPRPWSFDPATTFMKRMLAQIVGFRLEIAKIEGKFKLNQNHPIERRKKVAAALGLRDDENSQAIATAMQATFLEASDPS